MRQIIILTFLILFCSSFIRFNNVSFQINLKIGSENVTDLNKLKIKLVNSNRDNFKIQIKGNTLEIEPFLDSAELKITYDNVEFETSMHTFLDYKKINSLDLNILTQKEIEQKYSDTSIYKNVYQAHTILAKPIGHGEFFFIESYTEISVNRDTNNKN